MKQRMVVVGAVLVLSCSEGARSQAAEPPVLRAWDPLASAQQPAGAKKAVGEDCATQGSGGCGGGVCLHVEPHANRGYFCSKPCSTDDDCPETWACRPMIAGQQAAHCVPPKGWSARTASERSGPRSATRPQTPTPTLPLLPVDGGVR